MRFAALAILVLAGIGAACDSGAAKYDVAIAFNESVTQADMDAVSALLEDYDSGLDFLIQESFPPTGRAVVETDADDFCATVEAELNAKPYVRDVTCGEHVEEPQNGGDTPVSSTPLD